MKMRFLHKRGMSLIEVVFSMWLMGIVVVSVMSMSAGQIAKGSQARLQALSLARSEYERCRLLAELSSTVPKTYAVIILHQDSVKKMYNRDESKATDFYSRKIVVEDSSEAGYIDSFKTIYVTGEKNAGSKLLDFLMKHAEWPADMDEKDKLGSGLKPFVVHVWIEEGSKSSSTSTAATLRNVIINVYWTESNAKGFLSVKNTEFVSRVVTSGIDSY